MIKTPRGLIKLNPTANPTNSFLEDYDSQIVEVFELSPVNQSHILFNTDTYNSPLASCLVTYVMNVMDISFMSIIYERCTNINEDGIFGMRLVLPCVLNNAPSNKCYIRWKDDIINSRCCVRFIEFINMETHVSHTIVVRIDASYGLSVNMNMCLNEHPYRYKSDKNEYRILIGKHPIYHSYEYRSMQSEGYKPLYDDENISNDLDLEDFINSFISWFIYGFEEKIRSLERFTGSVYKMHSLTDERMGDCLYDMSPNLLERFYYNEKVKWEAYKKANDEIYINEHLKNVPLSHLYPTWFKLILKPKHIEALNAVFNGTLFEFCNQYDVKKLCKEVKGIGAVTAKHIDEYIRRYTNDIMFLGMTEENLKVNQEGE